MATEEKVIATFISLALSLGMIFQSACAQNATITTPVSGVHITSGADVLDVEEIAPNILHVHIQPDGQTSPRTLVIDPGLKASGTRIQSNTATSTFSTTQMTVSVLQSRVRISITKSNGERLIE